MRKIKIVILIFAIISAFIVFKTIKETLKQPNELINEPEMAITENPELSKTPEEIEIIEKKVLEDEIISVKHSNELAFTSQAPYAKWDRLHDEACEEAAIIIAHNYLLETEKIEIGDAEDEIQKMVAFQKKYFGSHKDLTAQEMIDLAWEFYGERYYLVEITKPELFKEIVLGKELTEESCESDPSEEEVQEKEKNNLLEKLEYIKKELSKGNIFIVPAAGRELENPYFKEPGPLYHVLVLNGYDDAKQEFITHDPGTRRGKNFHYSYEIILNAIHDFPGKKSNILEGEKNIILVEKNK